MYICVPVLFQLPVGNLYSFNFSISSCYSSIVALVKMDFIQFQFQQIQVLSIHMYIHVGTCSGAVVQMNDMQFNYIIIVIQLLLFNHSFHTTITLYTYFAKHFYNKLNMLKKLEFGCAQYTIKNVALQKCMHFCYNGTVAVLLQVVTVFGR